jgi:hypothetical protein
MQRIFAIATCAMLSFAGASTAQEAKGTLTADGKTAALTFAVAQEVDSRTENGYMDVVVVLSDRKLAAADVASIERLEALTRKDGLVALVVRIDPDAKVTSAEMLHPAFTTFLSSAAFVRWKPTTFDERQVAGRFWTDGTQDAFRQQWSYDVTFAAPIALDPQAKTLPKR